MLMKAALLGWSGIVKLLVSLGADTTLKEKNVIIFICFESIKLICKICLYDMNL